MLSYVKLVLEDNLSVAKYLLVSVGMYVYIMSAIYLLVDYVEMDKVVAYVLIYVIAYVFEYTLTLRVVFKREHQWGKVFKFIAYVVSFLVVSTIFYRTLIITGVYYLFSALAVAIFLMPIRYIVNKYWVYR